MLLAVALAWLLNLSFVFGSVNNTEMTQMNCGTFISDEQVIAAEERFAAAKITPPEPFAATLNVYFHVIAKDTTESGGNVPNTQITNQINVLNNAFTGSGITWKLAGVDRTLNPTWFNAVGPGNLYQTLMKNSLRKGGVADLNVYTVGFVTGSGKGLGGYATFPFSYAAAPRDDGVVLLYSSLPGGSSIGNNLGQILTHEAGHWVGLFHTFQGGCFGSGDYVADTPPEREPVYGCPGRQSSCFTGVYDPIHNFMDYTSDSCRFEFTPGQIARLKQQMATFRQVSL